MGSPRDVGIALALLAGCYSPRLGNPSFFCHPTDDPACPDGQICSAGRCINSGVDGGMRDAPAPADLSNVNGMLGCHGYAQCLLACGTNPSCPATCDARLLPAGMTAWQSALGCGQSWCLGPNAPTPGPGTGDCQIDPFTNKLVDAFGAPTNACAHCLDDAFAGLFGTPCSSPSAPACNPAMCSAPYQSCLSNLP